MAVDRPDLPTEAPQANSPDDLNDLTVDEALNELRKALSIEDPTVHSDALTIPELAVKLEVSESTLRRRVKADAKLDQPLLERVTVVRIDARNRPYHSHAYKIKKEDNDDDVLP